MDLDLFGYMYFICHEVVHLAGAEALHPSNYVNGACLSRPTHTPSPTPSPQNFSKSATWTPLLGCSYTAVCPGWLRISSAISDELRSASEQKRSTANEGKPHCCVASWLQLVLRHPPLSTSVSLNPSSLHFHNNHGPRFGTRRKHPNAANRSVHHSCAPEVEPHPIWL